MGCKDGTVDGGFSLQLFFVHAQYGIGTTLGGLAVDAQPIIAVLAEEVRVAAWVSHEREERKSGKFVSLRELKTSLQHATDKECQYSLW
ncbi:hypothetical protein [uncultured Bacteroides sp.]|uniref:hypothetical protein n=1 Tax=uncultured Bacteroides sp. TaxID=162156 RepID=UPI002616A0B8|nr:hypothetical protein [uncultured Bacteroides sp.]